jgi:hypothetical protein
MILDQGVQSAGSVNTRQGPAREGYGPVIGSGSDDQRFRPNRAFRNRFAAFQAKALPRPVSALFRPGPAVRRSGPRTSPCSRLQRRQLSRPGPHRSRLNPSHSSLWSLQLGIILGLNPAPRSCKGHTGSNIGNPVNFHAALITQSNPAVWSSGSMVPGLAKIPPAACQDRRSNCLFPAGRNLLPIHFDIKFFR